MKTWSAQSTLLLVGEGSHEVAFLSHVKKFYVSRGCGLTVTIKNARGKGAKHVVETAIKSCANAAYDKCGVLLDTDTDFTTVVRKNARANQIELLLSDPCLEHLLLRIIGKKPGKDTKKQLLSFIKNDPTDPGSYAKYFSQDVVEAAQATEEAICKLIALFKFRSPM